MPQGPAPTAEALTLMEWQKFSNSPMVKAVAMSLYEQDSVLTMIPMITKKTMTVTGARFTGRNMPRVDWAKVNDIPIGTKATPERYVETGYIIRNTITTDRYLKEDENSITDLQEFEVKAYLESVAYKGNDYFINNVHDGLGDHDDAPLGIKARIMAPSAQYGVQAGLALDAGGVDISPGNVTAQSANTLLLQVDRLLAALNAKNGVGVTLFTNEKVIRLFAYALRNLPGGAGFSTTRDNYDREVLKYRDAVIKDIGRRDDQYSYIISPYELANGANSTNASAPSNTGTGAAALSNFGNDAAAGNNFSSIYAVRFGQGYLSGWQWEPLVAKNFGLVTPPGTYYQVLFDWLCGWKMESSRSLARLYDIKIGA